MKPMSVEVALAGVEPKVVGVQAKAAPEPEPQDTPEFESTPLAENVAQPAAPPALDTMRFVVLAVVAVIAVVDAYGNCDAAMVDVAV